MVGAVEGGMLWSDVAVLQAEPSGHADGLDVGHEG